MPKSKAAAPVADSEADGLRRTIRDLVAMSTLPAVWSRSGIGAIAESLAEVMVRTLGLELVYIRTPGNRPGEILQAASRKDRVLPASRVAVLGQALGPLLQADDPRSGVPIVNPLGSGTVYPALVHFGSPAERGTLFAGSCDPSFPTTHDRLILGVSVNLMALMQQRSRAETALRESEKRHTMITELLPQLVWIADAAGRLEHANRRWQEYTGLTVDDVLKGATPVHPDDFARARTGWEKAVKEGTPYEAEYRIRAADGHYEWFLAQGLPDRDEKGRIVKWYGSCTNIDAQRRSRLR
jgi:PAS domain S-box-containing protein